jgi:hypothetical protein
MTSRSWKPLLTPLFLLAVFVIVDRLLVQPNVAAYDHAKTAYRAAKEEHERAVFEADRAAFLAGAFQKDAGRGSVSVVPLDYLNALLGERGLEQQSLGRAGGGGKYGEPYELTVRGRYSAMILFIRDLEASPVDIHVREFRITKVREESGLEMRARLEFARTES